MRERVRERTVGSSDREVRESQQAKLGKRRIR
jgi:hypothetical protein